MRLAFSALSFLSVFFLSVGAQESKIDSLRVLLKTDKEDTNKVNHLNALGWHFSDIDNPDTAIIFGNQALLIAKKLQSKKHIASSFFQIAWADYLKGNYVVSLDNNLKALELYEKIKDRSGMSRCQGNIALVHSRQGEYQKALQYYSMALKIKEELGDKNGISIQLGNIGLIYENKGDYPKALEYHLEALKIDEEINNKTRIGIRLFNIGNIYMRQANHSKSLYNFTEALKLFEANGYKIGIAACLSNIGSVYYKQGDYPMALKSYLKALTSEEEIGDKIGFENDLNNIGDVYFAQKDFQKALDYYFQALKMAQDLGDKQGIVNSQTKISSACIEAPHLESATAEKKKGYQLAEKYLLEALKSSREMEILPNEMEIEELLSSLYAKTNRFEQALEHYKKSSILKDSIFNIEKDKEITKKELNFEFEKKEAIAKAEHKMELENQRTITDEKNRKQKIITYAVSGGLFLVLLLALFIFRGYKQKQKANKYLAEKNLVIEQQKKIVEEHNKDITDSINYAQRIQRALLASDNILNKNLAEHFVLFKPKDIVSGDFYWAIEKDGRFYLAVCDSTGHGVPGAFMSLLNISFLNEAISEKGIKQPNEILNHARQRLIENLSSEGAKDGMDGILVCFDKNNNTIFYSAAHNAPVIVTNGALTELDSDNMPVGLADRLDSFKYEILQASSGSVLYLYTDGFADQFGGPKGKKFKYKQLNDLLLANSSKTMSDQKDIFEKTFENWKGNLEQVDDVLLIGIRI